MFGAGPNYPKFSEVRAGLPNEYSPPSRLHESAEAKKKDGSGRYTHAGKDVTAIISFLRTATQLSRRPKSPRRWPKTKKLGTYCVLLLVVLGMAARPLARGASFYQSYWGGAVFVPLLLVVAALILVIAVINGNRK
jgi:hypothetical protein